MPEYQVMYWRGIPAQVRVFDRRRPISSTMPERFQQEIDRVAMEEGLEGTDDYLEHWQWTERRVREGEPAEILAELLLELEAKFDCDGAVDHDPAADR